MKNEKNIERTLRRKFNENGYLLHKSRTQHINLDDLGGYCITWLKYNACVAGPRFELDLCDVADFVQTMCE